MWTKTKRKYESKKHPIRVLFLSIKVDFPGLGIGVFPSGLFFDDIVDGLGGFGWCVALRRLAWFFLKQAKNRPYQMHATKAEGKEYKQPKNS